MTNTKLQVAFKMVPCWFFLMLWVALFVRNCTVNHPGLLVTVLPTGLELLPASKFLLAIYFLCALWQVSGPTEVCLHCIRKPKRTRGNSGFFKGTSSSRD